METVTEAQIRGTIRNLNLSRGLVCLHSSLRSFGHVEGGAASIVRAFLAEGCTLMVPSFSDDYRIPPPPGLRPERNGYHYGPDESGTHSLIYSPQSVCIDKAMGAVAAYVVNLPGRSRGLHPFHSFSAAGPSAAHLIAAQSADDAYGPLQVQANAGGFVLLAGVDYRRLTLLHLAERRAGRVTFRRWANQENGEPGLFEAGGCSEGFNKFAPYLDPLARMTLVGSSKWILLPAAAALRTATSLIRETPAITVCGRDTCERCADALQGGPILN